MIQNLTALKAIIQKSLSFHYGAKMLIQHRTGKPVPLNPPGTYETLITTAAPTREDNGKVFLLSLAGGFTTTLPVPEAGLKFKFIVKIAPTTAYVINTKDGDNIIHGQIATSEDAAGSVVTAAASDRISFVANLAIIGDWVEVESDGTNWYVSGMCKVQDGIVTAQIA